MAVKDIAFSSGYITVTFESGVPRRYPIADMIRVLDIPVGLTYTQISSISALANLMVILIRTLIHQGTLSDSFLEEGELSLDNIAEVIENMGGDYGDPDLTGSAT